MEQPKKQKNKFSFGGGSNKPSNFYWIYAVIGLALISLNLINWGGGTAKISESEFQDLVINGEVEEVIIVKNKNIARVVLTKKALQK